MDKKYDLVIVGGGPAGLMAAKVAGENGLKTALLERKVDLTKIMRIDGGILSPVNEYTFGQITTFNPEAKRISFPVCGFSIRYEGPYKDVFGFDIYSPGGKRIRFGNREEQKKNPEKGRVAFAMDKQLMLTSLLEDARSAGVAIFPGTNVTAVEKKEATVIVTGNGEHFEGLFVIAADGVNSRIARLMGLNKERKFFSTHLEYAWYLEDLDIPQVEGISFIMTMDGTFYVTTGCKDRQYHVGVSTFNPKDNLKEKLGKFVYENKVFSPWFKGGKKTGESSCVINMLSPMERPFKDNVIFAGDAAWLMEVTNAAAICCGWKAANAVTLALLDNKINEDGIISYLEWWGKYFYGPYGKFEFKPIELQQFLSAEDMDYLASLVKEPLIATNDFYKLVSTLGSTYGELFPVIQQERPDIMEKLMGMVNKMEEAEAEAKKAGFTNR